MANASGSKSYMCTTCGRITTKKGHLCTPLVVEDTKLAICEYCGVIATDPRHVCFPKRLDLKYYCENCGRIATTKSLLCTPRSIPQPKPSAVKKKVPGGTKAAAKKKPARAAKKPR